MKTKVAIQVIFILSIIIFGCKYRSNIKSTALSKEDFLFCYSNDTLIIAVEDDSYIDDNLNSIIKGKHTRNYLKIVLNNYDIDDFTDSYIGPPYVLLFYKEGDTLSFFANLPIQQDTLYGMEQATLTNPTDYFNKYSVGVTTTKDILNYYDMAIDAPINYIIICKKSDFLYINESKRVEDSDNMIIVLCFYHNVLKRIEIKHLSNYNIPNMPFNLI